MLPGTIIIIYWDNFSALFPSSATLQKVRLLLSCSVKQALLLRAVAAIEMWAAQALLWAVGSAEHPLVMPGNPKGCKKPQSILPSLFLSTNTYCWHFAEVVLGARGENVVMKSRALCCAKDFISAQLKKQNTLHTCLKAAVTINTFNWYPQGLKAFMKFNYFPSGLAQERYNYSRKGCSSHRAAPCQCHAAPSCTTRLISAVAVADLWSFWPLNNN